MIVEVANDSAEMKQFLALPEIVYRGDPHYCAVSPDSVLEGLRLPRWRDSQRLLVAM